jgi:hypothetical protein
MVNSHHFMPEKVLSSILKLPSFMSWLSEVAKSRNGLNDRVLLPSRILRDFGSHELIGRFGNREVLSRLDFYIRLIRPELDQAIKHSVRPEYRDETDLQDDVASSASAAQLMSFILEDDSDPVSDNKIERAKLRSKHARLILALAIMAFIVDAVDEASWVGEDLVTITQLMKSAMSEEMVNIAIVGSKNPENGTVNKPSIRVFPSFNSDAATYKAEIESRGEAVYETRRLCNSIKLNGKIYYIATYSRRKLLFDIISKCIRAESLTDLLKDNRGIRHSIVAVEEEGDLRVGNRQDAQFWSEIIYQKWTFPLVAESRPVSKKAKNGSANYWDIKILGRYYAIHDDLPIAGRVEMQITTIVEELAQAGASAENHDWYAMSRFYRHVLPVMWPHFNWLTAERLDSNEEYWRGIVMALNSVWVNH